MPAPLLPVLMYHSVSDVPDGPLRPLAVPRDRLVEQLAALAGAGYALVGLTEALDRLARDPLAQVIAVTFDDGFLDFLTDGVGALAETGATATLYLAVEHLADPAWWLGARAGEFTRLMTWAEVREVAATGLVEVGSHSLVHVPLDNVAEPILARQVGVARDRLREKTQAPVWSFAYPHGYHTARVRRVVAAAGHRSACEVGHGRFPIDGDRLAIPRLQVTPDLTGADLLELVRTGGSRLMPVLKDLARPTWRLTRRAARDLLGVRLT